MMRYIIIITAIVLPFVIYYLLVRLTKKVNKKFPLITLSLISLLLLICCLIYFRFTSAQPKGLNYTPPKYENNKVVPPKIK
jgi:predicted PurR-regulated permease PerM